MKRFLVPLIATIVVQSASAQTAASLFSRADSLQIKEFTAPDDSRYKELGHHGPAVENCMMALRIYFNDSGAIDVYSKSGDAGMELLRYKWYPGEKQMTEEGAGCDEYFVGKSLGLGGIGLWDGQKVVGMSITKGRKASVGRTANGNFAEVVAYGVPYKEGSVDIAIRVDVVDRCRDAIISAKCLSGQKVQFVTGVNYNKDAQLSYGRGFIAVWGVHPANVSNHPIPIGGGMSYDPAMFPQQSLEENMIRLISVPAAEIRTKVVSASTKEKDLHSFKPFVRYVRKMTAPAMNERLGGELDNIAYSRIDDNCPINTMEHFKAAAASGFRILKTDMQLTKDGEIVLCHDKGFTLDSDGRITKFDRQNKNGKNVIIKDMTLKEVKALEHAAFHEEMGHYAHVATLEEFFRFCKKHKIRMYTTLRNRRQAEILERYSQLVKKYKVEGLIMMNNYPATDESFAEVRKVFPEMPFSYTMGDKTILTKDLIDKAAADGRMVLSHSIRTLDSIPEEMFVYLRDRGVKIYGHFVDTPQEIREGIAAGMGGFHCGAKNLLDE